MANRCWARRHSCWRRGSPCLRATWILVQGRESMDLARIWSRLDRGTLLLSRLHRHEFVRIISTVSTSSNRYSNRLAPWRRLGTAFERRWGFLLDSRISSEMVGRLASSDNGRWKKRIRGMLSQITYAKLYHRLYHRRGRQDWWTNR